MKVVVAVLLHIISVHYLFVLFTIGCPALVLGIWLYRTGKLKRYFIPQLLLILFAFCLFGSFIFPAVNVWYLKSFGLQGEAVIVNTSQEAGWFRDAPEVRLILKVQPDSGASFMEAVTTTPPLEKVDQLQVGNSVNVAYSPEYTHNLAITDW